MTIQSYNPENLLLRALIEGIYILEQVSDEPPGSFLILPSVDTYVSVSLNTNTVIENNIIITESIPVHAFDAGIQFGLSKPCIYEYRGKIKEICIRFKPLGVYAFFYQQLIPVSAQNNHSFIPFKKDEKVISEILALADHDELFKNIEQYLLTTYTAFTHPYLFNVINDLQTTGFESKVNLDILAKKYAVTRQTLNNQFSRYLNLSPSAFRQIWRFRKFIEAKLLNEKASRLTDIVYDIGFFDQSHLVKDFKKYASLNPLEFFKKINFSENRTVLLIWQ